MPAERKPGYRVANFYVAEGNNRRFRPAVLTIVAYIGYYFFAEVWPALLRVGSG